MQAQLLRNITNNVRRMDFNQNQLSTGKKINKPSDDPVGITYALRYRSAISVNEQYQRNIDAAKSSVDHVDTVLGNLTDVVQRVNELTNQGVTGTNPQSALDAISSELSQLGDETISIGNDQLNGRYTFNGQLTDVKPYTTGMESTDTENINYQLGAGVVIPVNTTGNDVFGTSTDTDNLLSVIRGIQSAFTSGNPTAARNLMPQLSTRLDKILQARSEIGARSNRVDLMDNRLKDLNLNLNDLSGKTEDADMAEVITKLKMDENVYQASLSTGAKIIQPSLMDYMK
ncbi:MAG: Flagellar hook protein FlgL [Bacilli bacterium]|nr:Flagellar hook protein FlgL [Bacilli bacterium]